MADRYEIKAALSVDEIGTITGTAWLFGSSDRTGDVIQKGAFATALAPLPMLFGHDPNAVVGVWDVITEDASGLQVKGRLLVEEIAQAREVRAMVTAGALSGLSIGFATRKAAPRMPRGRTITALDLVEISLVSVPAHPGARISSAKDARTALSIAERINRFATALRHERT